MSWDIRKTVMALVFFAAVMVLVLLVFGGAPR